ncbi:MAG: hypothetical protein FWH02_01255 [Oscillospiraceae bacterium]|nr:hypothetical protein [Oscillospiraceae bacterium]
MKKKLYYFICAFSIGAVALALLAGFALVDLSADNYMPGRFEPMLEIGPIDNYGVSVSLMGQRGDFSLSFFDAWVREISYLRGFLPGRVMLAKQATVSLYEAVDMESLVFWR